MQITVTMSNVLDFKQTANQFREKTLPLVGAYKLMKISNSIDKEIEFYSTEFQKVIETYAQKDESGEYKFSEDGSQILIQPDKVEECNDALEKLLEMEVVVDNLDFTINDLGNDIECTPEELENLMPFLK